LKKTEKNIIETDNNNNHSSELIENKKSNSTNIPCKSLNDNIINDINNEKNDDNNKSLDNNNNVVDIDVNNNDNNNSNRNNNNNNNNNNIKNNLDSKKINIKNNNNKKKDKDNFEKKNMINNNNINNKSNDIIINNNIDVDNLKKTLNDDDDDYLLKNIKHPINVSQISSILDSDVSSDMSDILKNDLIYEALNMKETNDYLLNSSTSFSELNSNDTDLLAADIKSLDDIKLEIVHQILEKKNKKKINNNNNNISNNNNNITNNLNSNLNTKLSEDIKSENIDINEENNINKIISIEKMSILSKINKMSINLYSLNLKYPSDERFVKYKIKYSIPDNTPILTKSHMYTQFITDTQQNNNTEIKLNHINNIKLKFDTQLLKYWLKIDTAITIEIEAIRDINIYSRSELKNDKNVILWKGIGNVKCRDLISLPNLKLKSYIPVFKETNKKKPGFY